MMVQSLVKNHENLTFKIKLPLFSFFIVIIFSIFPYKAASFFFNLGVLHSFSIFFYLFYLVAFCFYLFCIFLTTNTIRSWVDLFGLSETVDLGILGLTFDFEHIFLMIFAIKQSILRQKVKEKCTKPRSRQSKQTISA